MLLKSDYNPILRFWRTITAEIYIMITVNLITTDILRCYLIVYSEVPCVTSKFGYRGLGGGHPGGGPGGLCDRGGTSQYATLNRKFRTLEHPPGSRRGDMGMTGRRNEAGNSYTLGSRKSRTDGPGQYNTLSKKCKTLESSDFY